MIYRLLPGNGRKVENVKKLITILLAAALVLIITGCDKIEIEETLPQVYEENKLQSNQSKDEIVEVSRGHTNSIIVDSNGDTITSLDLPRLLESEIIVIGEFVGESKTGFSERYCELSDVVFRSFPRSFNQLRVTEVLQGDIKIGDIITISQRYAYFSNQQKTLNVFDDMSPMNEGDQWIYFLSVFSNANEYFDGIEHELGVEIARTERIYNTALFDGRYPLPTPAIAESLSSRAFAQIETADLGVLNRSDFNFDLYAEIIDHFDIAPRDWVNPGRASDAKLIEIVQRQTSTLCTE
jgi:hypothetical protein